MSLILPARSREGGPLPAEAMVEGFFDASS